jgi:hypothetical protein
MRTLRPYRSPVKCYRQPMPKLTPWVREVILGCYEQTGRWPDTLLLILQGESVPQELLNEGEKRRAIYAETMDL